MSAGTPVAKVTQALRSYVSMEALSGIMLVSTAFLGFAWANSSWADYYNHLLSARIGVHVGSWRFDDSLAHFVNDGLMAMFFFVVGLEIKRELLVGELSDPRRASLALLAAAGGLLLPATSYALLTWGGPASEGWGVPMATDIAFALGVILLLGDRVPTSVKVLLTAVAIIDDVAAVLVIALFYTDTVLMSNLLIALAVLAVAAIYGWRGGERSVVFVLLGVLAWYFMLVSGVHATVAGVLLAMTVPMHGRKSASTAAGAATGHVSQDGPLHRFETCLHPWVAFGIMPVFAVFNAGVPVGGSGGFLLSAPHALGVLVGLVISKPVGVLFFSWLGVRLGLVSLPEDMGWSGMLCVGFSAGIGFTMSLFIAGLAFKDRDVLDQARLAVLTASVLMAVLSLVYARWCYASKRVRARASLVEQA